MSARLLGIAAAVALSLASAWASVAGETVTGRVVSVADGDTFTLLPPGREQVRVRLTEIDAPEAGQPWGRRAKARLGEIVAGRSVRVVSEGKDRNGRVLGRVYVGATDVNAALVRDGAAWAYTAYLKDPQIRTFEIAARRARRGLWSLPPADRVPPWEWRSASRSASAAPRGSLGVRSCSMRCSHMTSCAEARSQLRQCGPEGLDGDEDGVPCEAICR